MLEYRPFEPKCAKNTLYCCYSLVYSYYSVTSNLIGGSLKRVPHQLGVCLSSIGAGRAWGRRRDAKSCVSTSPFIVLQNTTQLRYYSEHVILNTKAYSHGFLEGIWIFSPT